MKLMTLQQYMKMSKKALIRKITKTLRAMPKKKLAIACYNLTKAKLPRLSLSERKKPKRKALPYRQRIERAYLEAEVIDKRRKRKRKFSRKQLAAQRLFAKRARAGTLRRR